MASTFRANGLDKNIIICPTHRTRLKRLILGSRTKIINLYYRLDRLDRLERLDRLDRVNRLDSLDRLDILDRLDRLDILDKLDKWIDWISWIDWCRYIDPWARIGQSG